ncbi:MAG: NTP transferase domain-containing protein [Candidatus Omnitrophica bacterium]|nr:NTP transferase domain-containing protein [Candidatus Omnitrophota bacterium]
MDTRESVPVSEVAAIVLAAGEGTRMKSPLPKVLHLLRGRPLLAYVLDALSGAGVSHVTVVVGYKGEEIEKIVSDGIRTVWQKDQLGTGDAVRQAEASLQDFDGPILVLYGDTPLLTADTLMQLVKLHRDGGASCTLLTVEIDDPAGYGRIIRSEEGAVVAIREDKDATSEERAIREINVGAYVFNARELFQVLTEVTCANRSGEYYLTDTIALFCAQGKKVLGYKTPRAWETLGINSQEELRQADEILGGTRSSR